jgi:hypothetical protein
MNCIFLKKELKLCVKIHFEQRNRRNSLCLQNVKCVEKLQEMEIGSVTLITKQNVAGCLIYKLCESVKQVEIAKKHVFVLSVYVPERQSLLLKPQILHTAFLQQEERLYACLLISVVSCF